MERTTGRTNNMIITLLHHSGINVEDEDAEQSELEQMEVEHMGMIQGGIFEGGTKQTRHDNRQSESTNNSPSNSQNAEQA